jgi:tetratricopeptide (TPR) repeat protein
VPCRGWDTVNDLKRFVSVLMLSALALMLCGAGAWAESAEWVRAHEFYLRTDYAKSLEVLLAVPNPDAAALQLIGQDYFMMAEYHKATDFLEKAIALTPASAEGAHWLGRAYGRRAETSSPFTAPGYATKARQMFEKAVALDPSNREAIGDLFDYYLAAPGFLGGGQDKAEALAARVAAKDPAEGHYYHAQLADKRKQYDSAEQHLRNALQLAPRQAGRFLDLAKFLALRGRTKESETLFEEAARIAPENPHVLFERAKTYVKANRNLEEARRLLERYLQTPLTPNDPPKSEAQTLLKKIGA